MEKTCKTCGSLWSVREMASAMRDKDSIECTVCGDELLRWNGSRYYVDAKLLREGPAPDGDA